MTATDVKIVTKQVVINKHYSSHLIPITGDEKCIDEIQEALNELDELKRDVARYMELDATPKKAYNNNEYWKLREKLSKVGN